MKAFFGIVTVLVFFSACNNQQEIVEKYASFVNGPPYKYYWQVDIVKSKSEQKGYFVMKVSNDWGRVYYQAVRYDNWKPGTLIDNEWVQNARNNGSMVIVEPTGNGQYLGQDGKLYEVNPIASKDLEKMGAIKESLEQVNLQEYLTNTYGFSQERGLEIARLFSSVQRISQNRSLTMNDLNHFSKSIAGVDFQEFSSAIVDRFKKEELIQAASASNSISPEATEQILQDIMQQLNH